MAITIDEIHKIIREGAHEANKTYMEWSKGLWLNDSGAECLLVCEIAKRLYRAQSGTERLWLELSFGNILDILKVRNPRGINESQRADITLINRDRLPKFIIEVKRTGDKSSMKGDLDKIRSLVQNCSLTRGFLAVFMTHRVAYINMKSIIEDRTEFVKNYGDKNNIDIRIMAGEIHGAKDEDGQEWQSSSLSIEMSTRR